MISWNSLDEPTRLDLPKISSLAAKGWDIKDEENNSLGAKRYPLKHLGLSNSKSEKIKGKVTGAISTRQEKGGNCYIK